MRNGLACVVLVGAGIALGGCCTEPIRYWRATDLTSGKTFHTADTRSRPITRISGPVFVSTTGSLVGLSSYELTPIDRATWVAESGGADVSLRWGNDGRNAWCEAILAPASKPAPVAE